MIEKLFNVLLVEDDPGHAELVIRNLKRHDIPNKIFHVIDGEQALDFLFNKGNYTDCNAFPRPHLILLDLRLPKIDGLEVLKIVKTTETLSSIPLIILTTSRAKNDIEIAYKYNANSYLVKPIDYNDFNKLLQDFGYYWFKWNQKFDTIL